MRIACRDPRAVPRGEQRRIKEHIACFMDVMAHREAGCRKFKTDARGALCCVECGASFLTEEDKAEMNYEDEL